MIRRAWLCAAVLLAACGPVELLTARPPPVVEGFAACIERVRGEYAASGVVAPEVLVPLLRSRCGPARCDGACEGCIDDLDCGPSRLCEGFRCVGCPDLSECKAPAGYTVLPRNGCRVCEFAPAGECFSDGDCGGGRCVQGRVCASGCDRLDCCANVCADTSCTGRPPLGCSATCPDTLPTTLYCRTTRCTCGAGVWRCDVAAAPTSTLTPSALCLYP
jgi:hypothetical protein